MKLAAVIIRAPVAAVIMVLTMGCDSLVVSTPTTRETVVYWEPTHVAQKTVQDRVAPAVKKKCWYKNKRGKKRYRMRYSCS